MESQKAEYRQLAIRIADSATSEERVALSNWIAAMLAIRNSRADKLSQAKEAIEVTAKSGVILRILKMIAAAIKKHGWDERGGTARTGIAVSALTFLVFGSQGAGVAALGTAIGVPLWVVFGSGAMLLKVIYDELQHDGERGGVRREGSGVQNVVEAEFHEVAPPSSQPSRRLKSEPVSELNSKFWVGAVDVENGPFLLFDPDLPFPTPDTVLLFNTATKAVELHNRDRVRSKLTTVHGKDRGLVIDVYLATHSQQG